MEDRYWNQGFMNSYTFGNQLYKRVIFGCSHWKKLSITLFHLYSDSRTIASLQFFSVLWREYILVKRHSVPIPQDTLILMNCCHYDYVPAKICPQLGVQASWDFYHLHNIVPRSTEALHLCPLTAHLRSRDATLPFCSFHLCYTVEIMSHGCWI